jgi:hypothetical protein
MGLTEFSFLFCLKLIFFIIFIFLNICIIYTAYLDRKYTNINNPEPYLKSSSMTPELKKFATQAVVGMGILSGLITIKNEDIKQEKKEALRAQAHVILGQAEIKSSDLRANLCATTERVENTTAEVNNYADKIKQMNAQMSNGTLTPTQIESSKPILEHYHRAHDAALQKQAVVIKELQGIGYPKDIDIVKSGFSDLFYDCLDNYRDYISVLTSEQLVILVNL